MELEIDGQTKVQLGIALVIGLVVGAGIGAFVGSTALSGFYVGSGDQDVIGGEEDVETCKTGSSCIWLSHSGAYNVIIKYYDDGEKVGQTESLLSGFFYELNSVSKSVDTIKVSADALGVCGGVYRTFDGIEPDDYPVKITTDGAICTKSANINKEYSGDSNGLV